VRARLTPDLLLIAVLLVVTLGIATFAVRTERGDEDEQEIPARRTTYSADRGGYQAVFETLEALNYPVQRWRLPLDSLSEHGTLIIADPEQPITGKEWRGLVKWVRRGNLLIFLADSRRALGSLGPGSSPTGASEAQEEVEDEDDSDSLDSSAFSTLAGSEDVPVRPSRPAQPTPLAVAAPELRTRSLFHLDTPQAVLVVPGRPGRRVNRTKGRPTPPSGAAPSAHVPLYRDAHGTTVAYTRWGRGTILLCTSPWSLCNAGVGQVDNFSWLLAALAAYGPGGQGARRIGASRESQSARLIASELPALALMRTNSAGSPRPLPPILFDEAHHGYGEARGVLSLLAPIARLGLAQLVVAWLLLTYAVSRRFGGKVPDEGRVRRSRSEYLGSMAALLHHARAVDLAIAQVLRQFRHDACRALGLPRDVPDETLLTAAGTRGVDPERLRSLLEQAERLAQERNRTKQDEALTLARELVRIRGALSGQAAVERGAALPVSGN
jgi:hypothetical protein